MLSFYKFSTLYSVPWSKIEYNIGGAFNSGVFTAPLDGIYFFNVHARTYSNKFTDIYLQVNGSDKSRSYHRNRDDVGYDTLNLSCQFELQKGDFVNVRYLGTFFRPEYHQWNHFEGHLISEINVWNPILNKIFKISIFNIMCIENAISKLTIFKISDYRTTYNTLFTVQ